MRGNTWKDRLQIRFRRSFGWAVRYWEGQGCENLLCLPLSLPWGCSLAFPHFVRGQLVKRFGHQCFRESATSWWVKRYHRFGSGNEYRHSVYLRVPFSGEEKVTRWIKRATPSWEVTLWRPSRRGVTYWGIVNWQTPRVSPPGDITNG